MASRGKRAGRKKIKFKRIREALARAGKYASAVAGRVKPLLRRAGSLPAKAVLAIKNGWRRFAQAPRALHIITVYLLTILVVGGIFLWRITRLSPPVPDSSQWPFEWSDDWEDLLGDSDSGAGLEEDGGEAAEPTSGGQSEAQPEETGDETPPADPPPPGPVFTPGVWPVQGDLLYAYGDMKKEKITPSTKHYSYASEIAIKASPGTAVVAAWDGTVVAISSIDEPYGMSVTIEHSFGLRSYYGALAEVSVQMGETVRQGQTIGTVAPGYENEDSYLYLKIFEDGEEVDPLSKLAAR